MNQLIINVGPSGCGKTTWTTEFIKTHPNYARINRDDIRKTLFGEISTDYYKSYQLALKENLVTAIEEDIFLGLREPRLKFNIIVDNTNLQKSYLERWIKLCDEFDLKYSINIFPVPPIEELKLRVAKREGIRSFEWKDRLSYIDKQYVQYNNIVNRINEHYKHLIYNE